MSLRDCFDEMLDECNNEIELGGVSYAYSSVFYDVDRVAYEQEFWNWVDFEVSEGTFTSDALEADWDDEANQYRRDI